MTVELTFMLRLEKENVRTLEFVSNRSILTGQIICIPNMCALLLHHKEILERYHIYYFHFISFEFEIFKFRFLA